MKVKKRINRAKRGYEGTTEEIRDTHSYLGLYTRKYCALQLSNKEGPPHFTKQVSKF